MIEPKQRISPLAVKLWRIHALITYASLAIFLFVFILIGDYFGWKTWLMNLAVLAYIPLVIGFVIDAFVLPAYKQKTWRYEVDGSYIQLKYGSLNKNFYAIPVQKVQYVNVIQGPISNRLNLSTVKIGTMAYEHEIPAIPNDQAVQLREKIAYVSGINQLGDDE